MNHIMHIDSLPHSMLRHIMEFAAAPLQRWWNDWKHTLALVQVSRHWRHTGMDVVYSQLHVFCMEADANDDSDDEGDDVAVREIRTYGAMRQMAWATNGPLVLEVGATRLVREVRLNLHGPGYMFPYLSGVTALLAQMNPAAAWPRVRSLSVHLASDYAEPDAMASADGLETAAEFADALACAFPRVRRLRVGGSDASEAFCRFADRLTYRYAERLRILEAMYPVSCVAPELCGQLAALHLTVRPYIGQLVPHVVPRALRRLCLDGVSVHFRWQCFYGAEGRSRNLRFEHLEQLAVHYNAITSMEVDAVVTANYSGRTANDDAAGAGTDCWLEFPRLRTLAVTRCPPSGGLLRYCSLPQSSLESVSLDGALGAVCELAQFVGHVTCVADLSLSVRGSRPSTGELDAMVDALNRLYSEDWRMESGALCLFDEIALQPSHIVGIQSVNLRELTVDSALSLGMFVRIIETQPQLLSISCYSLQIAVAEQPMDNLILEMIIDKLDQGDIDSRMAEAADDDSPWANVQPLESQLESIVVSNHVDLFSCKAALSLVCWLMLSIRSLKYILASRLSLKQATRFVELASPMYPHLLDIDINTS
ncbi:hypothetical protein EV175_003313 [Coemansia sp. RSA 1933]|nr:hypothetical protein EV175_003313 [Coemansia sp. RSA 1933]